MRRLLPLFLLALAACPRTAPDTRQMIDCASFGRAELGGLEEVDCEAEVERLHQPLAELPAADSERPAAHDPLHAEAEAAIGALGRDARTLCAARNRCEMGDSEYRQRLGALDEREEQLRQLVLAASPASAGNQHARRALATVLGFAGPLPTPESQAAPPCPAELPRICRDGTCVPEGASCCDDATYCEGGVCCGEGCCGEGELCGEDGTCMPAPRCGGAWPVACPDGSCAPAGADCCGEGRFCRNGICCGEDACCTAFEACVAGRCVPGAQASCDDPARPIPCADGACAPLGGSCCGGGRICESGGCCGESSCCLSGEQCVEGRCVGPPAPNPDCGGAWPVTCADGTCAPAGAACCGEGRFCQAGSTCCGESCCLPGEVCTEGVCVGA